MSDTSEFSIVTTADGSKTIFHPQVKENYHSRNGALQESNHVFLNSGLRYFLADKQVTEVAVLEIGFGTGLNFLLTADFCTAKEFQLNYVGIEAFPLPINLIKGVAYEEIVSNSTWNSYLQKYTLALKDKVEISDFCDLTIAHTTLENYQSDQLFDVIYFDAFASSNQPEMWTYEAISHTLSFLKPGGVFVTYAMTGDLKRIMKSHGLKVEKAPGAAGKREMLRATKG